MSTDAELKENILKASMLDNNSQLKIDPELGRSYSSKHEDIASNLINKNDNQSVYNLTRANNHYAASIRKPAARTFHKNHRSQLIEANNAISEFNKKFKVQQNHNQDDKNNNNNNNNTNNNNNNQNFNEMHKIKSRSIPKRTTSFTSLSFLSHPITNDGHNGERLMANFHPTNNFIINRNLNRNYHSLRSPVVATKQASKTKQNQQTQPIAIHPDSYKMVTDGLIIKGSSLVSSSSSSSLLVTAPSNSSSATDGQFDDLTDSTNATNIMETTMNIRTQEQIQRSRPTPTPRMLRSSSDSLNSSFKRAASSNDSGRSLTTTASINDDEAIFNEDANDDDDDDDDDDRDEDKDEDEDEDEDEEGPDDELIRRQSKQLKVNSLKQNEQQFEIVWRDLAYKVPKRFSEELNDSFIKFKHLLMSKCFISTSKPVTSTSGVSVTTAAVAPPVTITSEVVLVVGDDNHNVNINDVDQNNHMIDDHKGTSLPRLVSPLGSGAKLSSKHYPSSPLNGSMPTLCTISNGSLGGSLDSHPPRRCIFSELNGCIRSGQLTAILGPSGAGKTTFLKCLTNSIGRGLTGSIEVNGGSDPRRKLKLCMIPQQDYLLEHLTVLENLTFASRIKNTIKHFNHEINVERVIDMLRLRSCLHLRTGKISGGQHKRVSIAQELLSNPDILILDEPTSGLDSFNCFHTISVLQDLVNLSRKGLILPLAVVMTIHQPEYKIFNLFHHVYILSNMGQCIYEGPPELLAPTIGQYCKSLLPEAYLSLKDCNPASFIIELASEEYGQEPIEALASLQRSNFISCHHQHQHQHNHQHHHHHRNIRNSSSPRKVTPVKRCRHLLDNEEASSKSASTTDDTSSTTGSTGSSSGSSTGESTRALTSATITTNGILTTDKSATIKSDNHIRSTTGQHIKSKMISKNNKPNALIKSSASQSIDGGGGGRTLRVSRRLKWRSNSSHQGNFWLHVRLLTCRTWLSMWRDPLLTGTRIFFHLVIPFIMAVIYSPKSGSANACPFIQREFDFSAIGSDETSHRMQSQHNELILTFENTSLFFVLLYAFSMCVLALTALSFPLNMHILMKETGNGWYSSGRFVMAKTLADLPIELTMPLLTMALLYPLTNQPDSYLHWRMLAMTLVMTLCTLISQTQGLLFGAAFMNDVKTAVFTSQAASLPWILLSGFTTRVSELPRPLQFLSFGSIYRLGIESILAIRYGFGMCPCSLNDNNNNNNTLSSLEGNSTTETTTTTGGQSSSDSLSSSSIPNESSSERPFQIVGVPQHLRSLLNFYMDSNRQSISTSTTESSSMAQSIGGRSLESSNSELMVTTTNYSNQVADAINQTIVVPTTTILSNETSVAATTMTTMEPLSTPIVMGANSAQEDVFDQLARQLSRANTFGVNIESCQDVQPYILNAREIDESTLPRFLIALLALVLILKVVLFVLVRIRVNHR